MNRVYIIVAKNSTAKKRMDSEDKAVIGTYLASVEQNGAATQEQVCTTILDKFHDSVAINNLEDFDISVYEMDGDEIFENPEVNHGLDERVPSDIVSVKTLSYYSETSGIPDQELRKRQKDKEDLKALKADAKVTTNPKSKLKTSAL